MKINNVTVEVAPYYGQQEFDSFVLDMATRIDSMINKYYPIDLPICVRFWTIPDGLYRHDDTIIYTLLRTYKIMPSEKYKIKVSRFEQTTDLSNEDLDYIAFSIAMNCGVPENKIPWDLVSFYVLKYGYETPDPSWCPEWVVT